MAPPRKLSEDDNRWIDVFANLILDQRQKHNGRVPRGVMNSYLQFLREEPRAIPVTRDMMKGRIKLLSAKSKVPSIDNVPAEIEIDGASVASAITRATFNDDDDDSLASSEHPRIISHNKQSLAQLRTRVLNEVTLEHVRLHELKVNKKDRLPRGSLEKLIQQKRIQLGLPDSVKISVKTIRNRREKGRRSPCPKHRGKQIYSGR